MKLQKIKAKLAALLVQLGTIKTDKAVLEYDGEELAVGMDVFVTDENGERKPAEDGEYVTEDEKTIVIAGGKVESINEKATDEPAEEPTESEPTEPEQMEEETPAEEPEGTEGETGEDAPKEETDKLAELEEKIDKLAKIVEKILAKIGEDKTDVEARLSAIEKMSAAKPAEEQMEVSRTTKSSILNDKQSKRIAEMSKNWRNM